MIHNVSNTAERVERVLIQYLLSVCVFLQEKPDGRKIPGCGVTGLSTLLTEIVLLAIRPGKKYFPRPGRF
jgi:hypothetical protein